MPCRISRILWGDNLHAEVTSRFLNGKLQKRAADSFKSHHVMDSRLSAQAVSERQAKVLSDRVF